MILIVCLFVFAAANTMAEKCVTTKTKDFSLLVYYDWPVTFYCLDLLYETNYYPDDLEDYGQYTCIISETKTGTVVFNSSFSGSYDELDDISAKTVEYRLNDIKAETATNYKIKVQSASYCWIGTITLKPQELVDETCEENLKKTNKIEHDREEGSIFHGLCDVPVDGKIPLCLVNHNEAKIYWLYDCNTTLPSNTYQLNNDDSLVFRNISYQLNPGVYTCVVEYNGMKRYRIHREMCVEVPVTKQTSLSCVDKKVDIGGDVEIECNVDAGLGIENSLVISGRINKLNASGEIEASNLTCFARADTGEQDSSNGQSSCMLTTLNRGENDVTCFHRQPTEEELQKQRTTLSLVFKIKNFQESDFGMYRATITRAGNTEIKTFKLTRDRTPILIKTQSIIIIVVPVIAGVVLTVIALCVLCRVEIRWLCTRIFASNERDVKKYYAYLAYYYCQDMPQTHPNKLRTFVMELITKLQQGGGKVFNNYEENSNDQYTIENIASKLRECHRAVILLTPEYINDQWGVFEAAEAWKNVIENDIKIVFISFSDTKSTIKNLEEKPRNFIETALKLHKVISWNGSLPLSRRFCMELETYMPKLPKNPEIQLQPTTPTKAKNVIQTKLNGSNVDANGNIFENVYV